MVRRRIALLSVLLPAALLASCSFFFASPFPQHLAQVTNLKSMSGELPDTDSSQVTMKVMNNGSREYLFLLYRPPFANFKLLVLDTQLQIVSRYEDDRLDPANRLGDLQLVMPSGIFVDGTILLDAAGQPLGPTTGLPGWENNVGFYTGAVPQFWFYDRSARTASNCYKLTLLFGSPTLVPGIPLSSTGASYTLQRVFHDVAADTVAFYFREEPGLRIEGVVHQASTFDADYSSYAYFFDIPSHFTIENVDSEHVHYTRDGTVIRSSAEGGDRKRLKLIGFDGAIKAEFPDFEHRTVAAFAVEGDHYYFLDLEERILYRANTWW